MERAGHGDGEDYAAPRRDAPRDRLAATSFSTVDLPPHQQFDAWRDFIASTVDLTLCDAPAPGFAAEQQVYDLGSLAFTRALMPGRGYVRGWRHWKKPPVDHWCLVLWEPSEGTRAPGGHAAMLGFRSLARPFEGQGADRRVLSLFIPRDLFGVAAPRFDALPGDIRCDGIGGLLADHLLSLERRLPDLKPADVPALAEATRMLLAACLVGDAERLDAAQDVLGHTLRERARRAIRENLAAPGLNPDYLCRALGVSRSRLYRLFEGVGGVNRYIQRQRLRNARDLLTDSSICRNVMQVAEAVGFADHSGFSRAFRAEFGYSPTEARAAAQTGLPRVPKPAVLQGTARDLGAVLAGLQA